MYAVVDIETTGGSASYHKITEIAVIIYDGQKVVDRFESLVNPERYIPPGITALTGITNEMVEHAPKFYEIARQVHDLTHNKVFVAHNVNFDYSFIRSEFNALGGQFLRKKLCTVRLARKIIPGMPSYSLGNLCHQLAIPIKDRHRAGGDADATTILLDKLIKEDKENFITYSLNRNSKEASLPPNLAREQFEKLPEAAGVYYFYDKHGAVVYVGKANDIKARVSTHFSGNTNTKSKLLFLNTIHDVSFEVCGNELISLLLENEEIKKYWPRYNRAYKGVTLNCGIYHYEDQSGFQRLLISKAGKRDKPVLTFKNITEATSFLLTKVKSYNLCLKLCGLLEGYDTCQPDGMGWDCPVCNGDADAGTYNKKFDLAYTSFKESKKSFIIIGNGREVGESSVVMVDKGRYLGFGFLPADVQVMSFYGFRKYLRSCYDNQDVQRIITSCLKKCKVITQEDFLLYNFTK